ncbi:hypothetical protein ACSHWB_18500 [Lentzea sp. HUAS TT2]|uniref:hypothetical protein n=1 Tax=Lentzea sp. HUAS TT2 TaxID=3447454 RepID=UPI003F71F9A1
MGASAWIRYADYNPDPVVVLNALHEQALASGEYHWAEPDVPRPTTVQALQELYGVYERLPLEGTHSVLDVFEVRDDVEPWTVRPMAAAEMREKFGTVTPTREQFDASYEAGELDEDDGLKWNGRFTTLFENGVPATTVVWGISGD